MSDNHLSNESRWNGNKSCWYATIARRGEFGMVVSLSRFLYKKIKCVYFCCDYALTSWLTECRNKPTASKHSRLLVRRFAASVGTALCDHLCLLLLVQSCGSSFLLAPSLNHFIPSLRCLNPLSLSLAIQNLCLCVCPLADAFHSTFVHPHQETHPSLSLSSSPPVCPLEFILIVHQIKSVFFNNFV